MSGHKLRVAKWRSFKAPSLAVAYATNHRSRQAISEEVATAMKERARFVAEFLNAQAGPSGRRLYSQVASNTAEARMKFMETAIVKGFDVFMDKSEANNSKERSLKRELFIDRGSVLATETPLNPHSTISLRSLYQINRSLVQHKQQVAE